MNQKLKTFLSILSIMILIGILAFYYIMHGGARNLNNEKTDYTVSSSNIISEFNSNIDSSNKKYLEKAVTVKGKVSSINGTEIILDQTVVCTLKNPDLSIKKGQTISIKGRIVGYDDLMEELKLDQCFVIKN